MKIHVYMISFAIAIAPFSILTKTIITNELDYPIKVDLIVEALKDEKGLEIAPGQTIVTQTKPLYDIVHIKSMNLYVNEGKGFPDKPTKKQDISLYGNVKRIIIVAGPADETGEREYLIFAASDLNP